MAGVFIVMVYALSSFCSILLLDFDSTFAEPTLLPTVLYCSLLYFSLKPFIRERPIIYGFKSEAEKKRFIFIGYALSLAVILGMVLILPKISTAINYGLVDARTSMYQGEEISYAEDSLYEKIGSLLVGYFGGIWYLYIIMFFYAIIYIPGKKLFKVVLIIASLSQIEVGLTVGGRTNAIYWLLSFIFTLLIFYPYLNRKARRITVSFSLVFLLAVTAYVAIITLQRSVLREGGLQGFLLEYMGESYLYFCEFFDNINWHPYSLERLFPFCSYLLGTGFNLHEYRDLIEQHTGMNIGIFYTFLGDIYVDIGIVGLLLFVFIFNRVASRLLRQRFFQLSDLFYLSFLYVIPLHGLFYYSFWKSGDISIFLILAIRKYVTSRNKSEQIIVKKTR